MFKILQRRSGLIFLKFIEKYMIGYKKDRVNFIEIKSMYQVDCSVRGDFISV